MFDFKNSLVFKLNPTESVKVFADLRAMLLDGEEILENFSAVRDQVVFTDKRIITANVKGVSGEKVDYTSIPYNRIQTFSIQTAGSIDNDSELELHVAGLGNVKLEFVDDFDIASFGKTISGLVLS